MLLKDILKFAILSWLFFFEAGGDNDFWWKMPLQSHIRSSYSSRKKACGPFLKLQVFQQQKPDSPHHPWSKLKRLFLLNAKWEQMKDIRKHILGMNLVKMKFCTFIGDAAGTSSQLEDNVEGKLL